MTLTVLTLILIAAVMFGVLIGVIGISVSQASKDAEPKHNKHPRRRSF